MTIGGVPGNMQAMVGSLRAMIAQVEEETGEPDLEMRAKLDELLRAIDEGSKQADVAKGSGNATPADVYRQLGEVEARVARVEALAAEARGDEGVQAVLGQAAPALQAMLDNGPPPPEQDES